MLVFRIIIVLTCMYALYNILRVDDLLSKIILGLQVLFMGLLVFESPMTKTISFILYSISLILIIIYGMTKIDDGILKKLIMISLAGILLINNIISVLHMPKVMILSKLAVLPIAGVAYLSYKYPTSMRNEFGFLVITSAFALINILSLS
ncbi:hypothetical protein [Marinigracilibium pacificum]|uniref:Uncharacterized protein n=1 Tax=Marinigracilibium pacificum TaxID=2729599 RepID=A0A848J6J7_9BACT|nr:hypothetical protein [Marinigracilibium pacificum]NMM50868.1 hypothetical protein [Marinigracilibium pacificum]